MHREPIDVILTSYCRWELLEETLDSFFEHNDWPIKNFFVYDDFGVVNYKEDDRAWVEYLTGKFPSVTFIFGMERVGQIKALDILMGKVTTELYYQIEEDWLTLKPGFIEPSIKILEQYPSINQVQLRGEGNINGHPVMNVSFVEGCTDKINVLTRNYNARWNGFGFNPSVRRLKDYTLIGSYSDHATFIPTQPWASELELGKVYKRLGFFTAVLPDAYITHTGTHSGIRS